MESYQGIATAVTEASNKLIKAFFCPSNTKVLTGV